MSRGIIMSRVKEILRLHYELKRSQHEIANILNVSSSSVNKYVKYFTSLGLEWPFTDEVIMEHLYKPSISIPEVDFIHVHTELGRHKSMTLQLIWEEYAEAGKTELSYSHFAHQYRAWKKCQPKSMRQVHIAGERTFIDYCGPTVNVIDTETGEVRKAHIFVGVLGASNYMYFDASWSQNIANWITSHVRMFNYFGGVTSLLTPDNLKSAVDHADIYEAEINKTYEEFARYYGTAVMPARPYRPKDKAKAENAVLIIERWVLMRLRDMTFYGLEQLNDALRTLMEFTNNRRFKKMPGTRREMFELLDKVALKALPAIAYEFNRYKKGRIGIDYHVELLHHYYSVPYQYVGRVVDIWYNEQVVEIYINTDCIAKHMYSINHGNTTVVAHMPENHRKRVEWTDERCRVWATTVGVSTLHLVEQMLINTHSERAKRSCLGLMSLAKKYGNNRLELASAYALQVGATTRKQMIMILESKLEQVSISDMNEAPVIIHENIRGSDNYI
jgi:transposase